ncbi:MAG: alpha/beta fold hydrolase [Clostridia bacterium]|nr:alpha/beta fold hydrolase [Clostridia bacterium]
MSRKTNKQTGKTRKRSVGRGIRNGCAALLAVLLCMAALLLRSCPASDAAQAAMAEKRIDRQTTIFEAETPRAGLIFYPGALVEHEAYAPLMKMLADRGITCLLVQMPFDLAVLDVNAAQGIAQQVQGIDFWMIGGHSLGGAMAAAYAAEHPQDFDALVLLGAYSQADLSDTAINVLSVLGSNDGVLSREKYEQCLAQYPDSFQEFVIEGGCHAFFGDYGMQKGDGKPSISRDMQMGMTASAIASMIE